MGKIGCGMVALPDPVSVRQKSSRLVLEQLGQASNFHFRTINLIISAEW